MKPFNTLIAASAIALVGATAPVMAETILKASHQFPGGKGDVRDEMVQMIARDVAKADVDLKIRVYPGQSLFKAREQWDAIVNGTLDITALPLDYASGRHPQFSATLMPGLVKNHDHARRLNDSAYMDEIKKIINDAGAIVLADAWLAGGFASKQNCVLNPKDVVGQTMRAAGPAFDEMLATAGASINNLPSSEIYAALQTGVLTGANTSSGSFVSYRIYEQVKCLTEPGDYALWFMYEPILISSKVFNSLTPAQQKALQTAGQKAEDFFFDAAKGLDTKLVDTYRKAGVEVVKMNKEQYDAWLAIAKQSSYKTFSEKVPGGARLIDMALSVD
jgi:TRAP-type C4-dicarboxylate transport system substrate-binding protein